MKTAVITSKNEFGQLENLGRAVLLNIMDHTESQGFYEYKFIDDPKGTTHCGWIDNSIIENREDI